MNRKGIRTGFLASAGIAATGLTLANLLGNYESIKDIPEYLKTGYFMGDLGNIKDQLAYAMSVAGTALTVGTGLMAGLETLINKDDQGGQLK